MASRKRARLPLEREMRIPMYVPIVMVSKLPTLWLGHPFERRLRGGGHAAVGKATARGSREMI